MNNISRYDAACRAVAEAKSFDEIKDIRDKSVAMAAYARQAKNRELETDAAEIRMRAERRIGELMLTQKESVGVNRGAATRVIEKPASPPSLSDAGIDKNLANRARKMAAIPQARFEGMLGEWRERIEQENERATSDILKEGERSQRIQGREEYISAQREAIAAGTAKLPDGVFEVVVMDPPWNYGREYDPDGSRVANPYPEMTQAQLLEMDPPFADDCALFLWTTHQFIWDAKALLDSWGFFYKATLVWDKEKIGMGAWLRMQCEFCLIGIKGKPIWDNTTWRDVIREPRREHSRKPDIFYQMVEDITVGRRLDYFSRGQRQGWEAFGNDTEKF